MKDRSSEKSDAPVFGIYELVEIGFFKNANHVKKIGNEGIFRELLALVKEVMSRDELKYCPHGRPICITLSKKQLEKQFKRT